MIATILIVAGVVVLIPVVCVVVGAVRYGTRTIHPEDYEE